MKLPDLTEKLKEECLEMYKELDNFLSINGLFRNMEIGHQVPNSHIIKWKPLGELLQGINFYEIEGYLRGFLREKGIYISMIKVYYGDVYEFHEWRASAIDDTPSSLSVAMSVHYQTAFLTAVYEAFKYLEEKK